MTTAFDRMVSVLIGPACPTCESDDLHEGAPVGALRDGRCRDCGTEYRWYAAETMQPERLRSSLCIAGGWASAVAGTAGSVNPQGVGTASLHTGRSSGRPCDRPASTGKSSTQECLAHSLGDPRANNSYGGSDQ